MGFWWREAPHSRHPKLSSPALPSTTIHGSDDDDDDDGQHVSSGSRSLKYDRAGWGRRRKTRGEHAAWRQTWQTGNGLLRRVARHLPASDCIT